MASIISGPCNHFCPKTPFNPERFGKGSIEEFISAALANKAMRTESVFVAQKAGGLINSFAYKNGTTIWEREINREVGLRLAGYFAMAFIDDPVEQKAFTDVIKRFAVRDALMEKGYYFCEGQAYRLYEPNPNSIICKRGNTNLSVEAAEIYKFHEQMASREVNEAMDSLPDDFVAEKMGRVLLEYCSVTRPANYTTDPE